jgi:AcrR family transcriptional regulator
MSDRRSTLTQPEAPTDLRKRRHVAKRAAIVAEAWDLARRDGLAAISLRDVAERVALRQPSLYAYFDSKLALYDAMFADGNRQLLESVAELSEGSGDPREDLVLLVEACVRFSTEDPVRHQLLFQRTIPGFEPSAASYEVAVEFYRFGQERLAAAGVADPADVDLFTALIAGLAHQQVANDPGGERWVRLARPTIEMFLADIDRRTETGRSPKKGGKR